MSLHEWDGHDDEGLDALGVAVRGSFEPMPAEARVRVRSRVLEGIGAERVPFLVRFARPLVALAIGASMVGGVSVAAAASAPGDLLYPLKRSAAAVATSLERGHAEAPALKPIVTPARTPASAVDAATHQSPVPSGTGGGAEVKVPARKTGSRGQQDPGRGKKPSKDEKHGTPAKDKSSLKSKSSSSNWRSIRMTSTDISRANGREK